MAGPCVAGASPVVQGKTRQAAAQAGAVGIHNYAARRQDRVLRVDDIQVMVPRIRPETAFSTGLFSYGAAYPAAKMKQRVAGSARLYSRCCADFR